MFSFFKRSKSKDDGDKKDKSKDKTLFSTFSKRQDSNKKDPATSSSTQSSSFPDYSLTVAAIDTYALKDNAEDNAQALSVSTATNTNAQQYAFNTTHSDSKESSQTTPETLTTEKHFTSTDEQQYSLTSCDLPNLSDSSRTSPVISEEDCCRTEDPTVSDGSERAGSSDRADSDIVFKTAPNTPVLAKHLTIVSSEVVIDGPNSVVESPVPTSATDSKLPLGVDLDFPSADGDHSEEESETSKTQNLIPTEQSEESQDCAAEEEEKEVLKKEPEMCEEVTHGPGELYDIAEEETSEEEDQTEEEEDEEEEEEEVDEDDDDDSGNVTQPTIEEEYPDEIIKKNQVNQETRELEARLNASEAESNKLLCKIDDLQRDVMVKSGGVERLQAELNAAHKESEFVKKRLKKLEEDLDRFKQKNDELTEEIQKKSGEIKDSDSSDGFDFNHLLEVEQQVKELTDRVHGLESQVEQLRKERDQLDLRARQLEAEREEERRIIQEALDNAIAEKNTIQAKFEKDFEKLRTVNTDREQQLLDDFEWKLREVNQACKKRLDEKENYVKQRIKTVEDKLKATEQELSQLERLKQFEAEATQLRGLNLEQQRALRFAERAKEELQVSEKVLQEELKKLKESLEKEKAALTTMQAIHNREIDEKDRKMRFRLEQQKNELNDQWEEKLRKETIRLRIELDQINREEKRMVLQSARLEKEAELEKAKEKWEQQFQDLQKEVETLKQKLLDKEEEHQNKIENIRTNSDRDVFELRRKLDKIDISYQDKIEKLQQGHEQEKERLLEESERRLQSCEQGWQLQLGSTRTTLELVKEQLKREASEREQALHENHRRQLEEQWEQLMQERDEIIAAMEENHKAGLEKMKAEMESAYKCRNSREQELVDLVTKMQQEVCGKKLLVEDLSTQAESLQKNVEELNQKVVVQDEQFQQAQEETDKKIKMMEESHKQACLELTTKHQQEVEQWRRTTEQLQSKVAELTTHLEQSKDSKLVEDLRKALSDKEHQVAQLSKEKHLYQIELMNRNCHGETVTARQRKRGGRGKPSKPGPSRGQQK